MDRFHIAGPAVFASGNVPFPSPDIGCLQVEPVSLLVFQQRGLCALSIGNLTETDGESPVTSRVKADVSPLVRNGITSLEMYRDPFGNCLMETGFDSSSKQLRVHFPGIFPQKLDVRLSHQDCGRPVHVRKAEFPVQYHQSILYAFEYFRGVFRPPYGYSRSRLEPLEKKRCDDHPDYGNCNDRKGITKHNNTHALSDGLFLRRDSFCDTDAIARHARIAPPGKASRAASS